MDTELWAICTLRPLGLRKAANVKMYHKDALGPAQLIPMLPKIVQEWRPVIWIEIPVNPRVPSDNTLAIALKPVDNF